MNNQWNSNQVHPGSPSKDGQVKMFDPTQFQTPAATGRDQDMSVPQTQQENSQAGNSSWNSWSSWDWNAESNTSQGGEKQQQALGVQETNSVISQNQHVTSNNVADSGYYGGDQYTGIWNQSWDGADQYSQPQQIHPQPGIGVLYDQNQQQQPVHDYQQYGGIMFGQEQNSAIDPNSQHQQNEQGYTSSVYDHLQQPVIDQGQVYNQYHDQGDVRAVAIAPQHQQNQQNQNCFSGQYYDHLQQEEVDQGQYQDHKQYHDQEQSYYDQPYDAYVWATTDENGQWTSDYQEHKEFSNPEKVGSVFTGEQQLNDSHNTNTESIPQTTSGFSTSHDSELTGPSLKAYDNDDDGTVSEFFGRDGDSDGDVQLDSQRHIHSSAISGNKISSGLNQFLTVTPSFHRTNSEISNASLSTLNLSIGEDDDGQEPLHNIQELVKRMEEVDLARNKNEETNRNVGSSLTGESISVGQSLTAVNDCHKSAAEIEQKQNWGHYSGFGNVTNSHNILPSSLPLDKNVRLSSPNGEQPSSAESGGSGGSSGLADWEIVPLQTGSLTHNSSLDNGVTFISDKPDGGVSMSSDQRNVDHKEKPHNVSMGTASNKNVHTGFQNFDPLNNVSHYNTSSTTMPLLESTQPHHDTRGRSGSPFVASFTEHRQEEPLILQAQGPSQVAVTSSPKVNSNVITSVLPPKNEATNSFKREDVMNPRLASILQSTKKISPSNSLLSTLPDVQQTENMASTSTHQNSDQQRSQGLAAVPLKHKLSASSLTEDGNCISKQESEMRIKSANTSPACNKQPEDPPVRSSSRNSEVAMSNQQLRHYSAFHPVSRSRHTTMSPATTLWDNSEAPTTNILLAPAMPLIIPNLNSHQTAAASTDITTVKKSGAVSESNIDRSGLKGHNTTGGSLKENRDNEKRDELNRSKERRGRGYKNRSFDSLDDIDAVTERQHDRSFYSQQGDSQESSYNQDSYRQESNRRYTDRPVSRSDRPGSRNERPSSRNDRSGHYHYERSANRTEDPYRRHRGLYRDYGDDSYDENYDRPRSRQDESHSSRPSSRSAQEVDRPRSRTNYDRDKDYYYWDQHKGYGYDSYGRNVDYYNDERECYYRYYREKEARYKRGYYEEYYGAKHADYYYQQQQLLTQQQPHQDERRQSIKESEHSESRNQSRGSTPATAPSPSIPPPSGLKPSSGPDYYGHHGSHPVSRPEYSRDYDNRGYSYEGYNAYYDGYGYDPYAYGYGYPTYEEYNQAQEQRRLTPPIYSYPHVRASFGPAGQLVKVLPNRPVDGQPAIVEVQDIQSVLDNCLEADDMKHFPGPLTRMHTHKKDVLLFCQQKARSCADDINLVDRESAKLIWRFLELLIKQNGSVIGTDLSDLLLEGHEPSTHEYSMHGVKISQSPEVLDAVPEGNSEDSNSSRASPAVHVVSDRTVINTADREREKWIDRFRNLLLYGHKKDALECAMKNNLWGHALFLASKMDARTHANVMTRFANGAIRMNDPLQTLYQLMSGRQPAAVTCVLDERWGDWRPHLAMILSNQTSRQDIDRKSITTMGDTLAAKGCLHASHFCYMMAQVNFGGYLKKTSKIVLIGSSHNLPLEEFATNDAIHCTEVFEYAQNLANPAFCLPHLQIFKYMYACRLADFGMPSEALQYCEVIAYNIQQYPTWFQLPFVKLVFQLSSKLKFSDPQRQISSEDAEDPVWLQQLEKICAAYEDGSIQTLSGTVTPAGFPGTTTSSESGDYNTYGIGNVGDSTTTSTMAGAPGQQQTQIDSSGHDIGVFSGQVQNVSVTSTDQQQQEQQQLDYSQQQQYNYTLWQQQYGYQYTDYGDQQQHQSGEQTSDYQQYAQQQVSQPQATSVSANADTVPSIEDATNSYNSGSSTYTDNTPNHGGSQLDSLSTSTHPVSQSPSHEHGSHETGQHKQPHRASISANEAYEAEDNDDEEDVTHGPTGSFDYFGNAASQKVVAPPHRYRHMSGSSTSSTTRRKRTTSGSSTGSVKAAPHKAPPQQQPVGSKGGDKVTTIGKPDNGGSGWFGGLFNKFKVKDKNEMILPDDKNPSIVWDPVKKKWTNADGTEEEETPAAPPPKDTDLISKPSAVASTSSGPPPPSSISGGNRFSLKAKSARNQYVDVTNPRSVTIPHNLFNVIPGAPADNSTAHPKMFTPGSGPTTDALVTDANNSNVNNNALTVPNSDDKLSRSSSMSSLSQEVQQFMAEPITDTSNTAAAAPSMPVLFNPASLKGSSVGTGQASSSSAAGLGFKYGQRRTYPK